MSRQNASRLSFVETARDKEHRQRTRNPQGPWPWKRRGEKQNGGVKRSDGEKEK